MNNFNNKNTLTSKAVYNKPQIIELSNQNTAGGAAGVTEMAAMTSKVKKIAAS